MQNFYELENLIEKKRLEEGMDDKVVGSGGRTSADYVPAIGKNIRTSGSDGFNGRGAVPDTPEGAKIDREIDSQRWDQAVVDNPDLDVFNQTTTMGRAEKAAAAAQDKIEVPGTAGKNKDSVHYVRGRSGRVQAKVGAEGNDRDQKFAMKLSQSKHPSAPDAIKLGKLLFHRMFQGKTKSVSDVIKLAQKRIGLDPQQTLSGLNLLNKVAGERLNADLDAGTITLEDPFQKTGSSREELDYDPEDVNKANDGGQFSPEAPRVTAGGPQSLASGSDGYNGRSAVPDTPEGRKLDREVKNQSFAQAVADNPDLASQAPDELTSVIGRANDSLMKVMNGEEIDKHILDDITSMENKLKSKATEDPDTKRKMAELEGIKDELVARSPQREWLDLYESMCNNGI